MALIESIDFLSQVAANESDESYKEPEELGPTRKLRVGHKIELYRSLDGHY